MAMGRLPDETCGIIFTCEPLELEGDPRVAAHEAVYNLLQISTTFREAAYNIVPMPLKYIIDLANVVIG